MQGTALSVNSYCKMLTVIVKNYIVCQNRCQRTTGRLFEVFPGMAERKRNGRAVPLSFVCMNDPYLFPPPNPLLPNPPGRLLLPGLEDVLGFG